MFARNTNNLVYEHPSARRITYTEHTMMCAAPNRITKTDRHRISHAIAYCETFASANDPSEKTEIDILRGTGVSPSTAVSILKQSLTQRDIPGSHIIINEMDRPEFLHYIARKLGFDD